LINPYAFLRKQAGYTQAAFCDEFGFAKQTLISIEQGVYAELSDRMLEAIYNACAIKGLDRGSLLAVEYGTDSLREAYFDYRLSERRDVPDAIKNYMPMSWTAEMSPMAAFVAQTTGSMQGFAKKLKVQTATILRYASGEQPMMPMPLREALVDCNYRHLGLLEKNQQEWIRDYA